ncbi:DUF4113 domain-containing protein, partial [Enterobacter bugandensis]|uniref:DUF4113 domain-containing protein n=1 Tax=Enterobacter bugandensis TaxID=881260 RepID=UPI00235DCADB
GEHITSVQVAKFSKPLQFAGRGVAQEWQMKREMLSPAYTTRWKEIPVAKIS